MSKLNKAALEKDYAEVVRKKLNLDMSRGKPSPEQLDLTNDMLLHCLDGDYLSENKTDCRNYGILDGIVEAKRLFTPMLGVSDNQLIVGGNSSLQLMYDTMLKALCLGVFNGQPWDKTENIKFLCPVPGYDRHFAITEALRIEMINVPMSETGPDMDFIEDKIKDDGVKGIWCVPMYSNPSGVTYSDDTVRRFASLKPAADNFRIFWDNAYAVHHLTDTPDTVLDIIGECAKAGNPNIVYEFTSTSKISFPGGGLAVIAASEDNIKYIKNQMSFQTIGFDKLNQLRHARFFKDYDGIKAHMERHKTILKPKFDLVLDKLEKRIAPLGIANWHKPNGGYFISYEGLSGTARRTVELCKQAGVILTGAGAPFPYGIDPEDNVIRLAPTYPALPELDAAMDVFCISAKIAAAEVGK
jgi:DNA-binding transcriptional MocR family regulator